jgi:hypothetical protein
MSIRLHVILLYLLFQFFFSASCLAQVFPDSTGLNIDSIEKELDAFLDMYYTQKNKSYIYVSTSLNNTQLSINNIALNAQQVNPGITLSPSIEYQHKSGLSLGYTNFFLLNGNNTGIVQHGINPGYTFSKKKKIDFGFYYTYFINNPALTQFASPYQHDYFLYGTWNDLFIQPSLSFGYSLGKYNEYQEKQENLILNNAIIPFKVYDTLNVKIRDFSSVFSLKKRLIIRSKKSSRYAVFSPSLMSLFIKNNYDLEYKSVSRFGPRTQYILQNRPQLAEQLKRQLTNQFPGLNETRGFLNTSDFQMQSLGLNLDFTAYLGKFFVNPRLYLDYYLLSSENKFNVLFSLQTGVFIN